MSGSLDSLEQVGPIHTSHPQLVGFRATLGLDVLLSQVCFPMPLCEYLNQTYETRVVTTFGLDQSLTPSKTLLQCMLFLTPKAPQSHGPVTVESE